MNSKLSTKIDSLASDINNAITLDDFKDLFLRTNELLQKTHNGLLDFKNHQVDLYSSNTSYAETTKLLSSAGSLVDKSICEMTKVDIECIPYQQVEEVEKCVDSMNRCLDTIKTLIN